MAQGVAGVGLSGLPLPDIPREVAGVGLIQGLVDPLREKVPVRATDNPLGDENHDLAQLLELLLVPDTLGLVAAEPAGVVHKEHVVEV